MNREELAWAAGFFDGEGYIALRPRKNRPGGRLRMQVAQVPRPSLDRLQTILGGKVYGPYQYGHRGGRQPYYLWHLDGFEHIQAAVAMLWPFLGPVKRRQARNALIGATPSRAWVHALMGTPR